MKIDVKKESGLSKKELNLLLKKWQKKLKMTDWKIDLAIVDFQRKDYRQSGDFKANNKKKEATIFLTGTPWRGDEEYTL